MRKKVYIFGAGKNGINTAKFIGKNHIIAFVDNGELCKKKVDGICVLNFDKFLRVYDGETVIISSVYYYEEINNQLLSAGIRQIERAPFISNDYEHIEDVVRFLQEREINKLFIYPDCYISKVLYEKLNVDKDFEIKVISSEGELDSSSPVLVVNGDNAISNQDRVIILNKMSYWMGRYKYLSKYKDTFKGKRCFIIGNGPSLRPEDLEKIKKNKDISFGCNGIHKIYNRTTWRPDYYFYGDLEAFSKDKFLDDNQLFFLSDLFEEYVEKKDNILFFHHQTNTNDDNVSNFSKDICEGVFGGRTVTYMMLQFAVYMGFSEIYLLGVDFSWGENGGNTHFCEGYVDKEYEKKIKQNIIHKEFLIKNYRVARDETEKIGVNIYNATRGGKLEVFKRVEFDSLFREEKNENSCTSPN